MTAVGQTPVHRFVEYLGELGPRWGLPADACRVHALLFVSARNLSAKEIAYTLALDESTVRDALAYLKEFGLVEADDACWRTHADPWNLVMTALNERRRRELPLALQTLRSCHDEALADKSAAPQTAGQIGKVRHLVEDLASLDTGMQRMSPETLRTLIGMSGRATRFVQRAFGMATKKDR